MTACLGVTCDVIGPAGFDISDRALRRAGLDYIDDAHIVRHMSFADFDTERRAHGRRLILLTTAANLPYTQFTFRPDDVLLAGRESAGVPEDVHEACDARLVIPMKLGLRSLNVAVAAAMVIGEALRQTGRFAPSSAGAGRKTP